MKLSMNMLSYWLREYHPITVVVSGERTITNARLFTENLEMQEDCVFVGRTCDFISENESDEILLMHNQDAISLQSNEINAVFNKVLAAFDYFSELEHALQRAALSGDAEQAILDLCQDMIGPSFILAPDYRILAISQTYTNEYVNPFWDGMVRDREISADSILRNPDNITHTLLREHRYGELFEEPSAAPYNYGIVQRYESSEGAFLGSLIVASDKPVTPFEKDISEIIANALSFIVHPDAGHKSSLSVKDSAALFLHNILLDREIARSHDYLKSFLKTAEDEWFQIGVIRMSQEVFQPALTRFLQNRIGDCIVLNEDGQLIMLLYGSEDFLHIIFGKLKEIAGSFSITCGVSNPYRDLAVSKYYLEQARMASACSGSFVSCFADIAISALLNETETVFKLHSLHPAVDILADLEKRENTSLLQTLKAYLFTERSISRTASTLFIHKNTVTYRINRIKRLNIIDFDNDYERNYVLLSLLIYNQLK